MAASEQDILRSELRWAVVVGLAAALIFVAILYAGLILHVNPPSDIETIDPKTLHLSAEFTEANLGTKVEAGGQVTTRIVATQFAFDPPCVVVPSNEPVTLRLTSPDVIHGILVTGTNVNTMVVPGYVAQVHTVFTKTGDLLMPCHEFCGFGHSQMWATVRVVPRERFRPDAGGRVDCEKPCTAANAVLWLWTTAGVAVEILFIVLPASLGWINTVDVGLTRTLFSWTLHPIVYFWLFPAYIAFYTMAPEAAGGRLYSDTLGRLSFILLIIYSLPVGFHHLLMDPQESTGFKFLQMFLTLLVTIPTFLTVFTIAASLEIAGRLRGGRGLFGWIPALPWERPMVLATGFSFVMLFFGGGGGLVNMAYGLNALVHNTSWVTAHFHLIFGGAVVIMYFAITYEIWPMLTGREPISARLQRRQLWLWFLGMMIMSLPWHWLGLHGQWRRVAQFDYSNPIIAAWGPWVVVSLLGGLLLLASALLFIWNLASVHSSFRSHPASTVTPYRFALAVHPPARVPAALNGFGLWNALLVFLMAATYGWPIAQQAFFLEAPHAVVHRVDRGG